jgi:hypothetical protein
MRRSYVCASLWFLCAAAAAGGEAPAGDPLALTSDLTVWPNTTCFRKSEPWIVANHDTIRRIEPRVLVLNFANDVDMDGIRARTEKFIRAQAESTRYHGFKDPKAPACVECKVAKYVDLRDTDPPPEKLHTSSSLLPRLSPQPRDFFCDYHAFFNDDYARRFGFRDPTNPARFLNLRELIEAGLVHELWFYASHDAGWPGFEATELKQYYDERGQARPGVYGGAGNGGGKGTMPWTGHSFAVYFFNPHRGTGCQIENFGHHLEGYANHDAIGSLTKYLREYAGLDLDARYGIPIQSFYALGGPGDLVTYPDDHTAKLTAGGKEYTLAPYVAFGGNVHFPPGARNHYDMGSPVTVKSVLENYRLRNGPDGKDLVTDFTITRTRPYQDFAPDCMGAWVLYWCQGMPGLDNRCLADDGTPLKNWWVYLIY